MINDIDEINVSIQDDNNVNVSIDNNNSISVSEGTPTDIAQIMHNEEIRQENETQRIANEEQRIENETAREEYITDLKQRVLDGEFNGQDGQDGQDGFSPIANVSKSGSTATISITDKNGTTTAEISDGTNGIDGKDGKDGEDGYSPSASVSKVGKIATITITDENGTTTCEIRDGEDGSGTGDMLKSTYDTDNNGIVDNAEKVNNHTVLSDVPANAVFTDTTYTAGTGIDITNNVISNTQTSAEWGNIIGTLSSQTDLMTALNLKLDKDLQSALNSQYEYNSIILDGLTPGTYPMIGEYGTVYIKLKDGLTRRIIDTHVYGGSAFLIIPKEIDYDSLENDDTLCYIICSQISVYNESFLRVERWVYDDTYAGKINVPDYYRIYLGKILTDSAQEINGTKTFNGGLITSNAVVNSNLSTYGEINFTDENDSPVFSFDGKTTGTPEFSRKIELSSGGTTITPTGNTDIANKKYVDDNMFSGNYNDLTNKPTIPSKTSDLTNDSNFISTSNTSGLIKNDGTIDTTSYSTFSGSYTDLSNKPTIPDELADLSDDSTHRVVTDTEKTTWNNKSDFSGSYNDLTDKPTIPTLDNSVSTVSTNGVENQAITNYVDGKISNILGTSQTVGYSQEYINNKFDFTTGEKRIGTWFDGKPLYRQVLHKVMSSTSDTVIGTINNVDLIITGGNSVAKWDSGGTNYFSGSANSYETSSNYIKIYNMINRSTHECTVRITTSDKAELWIECLYTKTTD